MHSMTVSSDLCRCVGAPLKNTPDLGVQRIFPKYPLDPQIGGILRGAPPLLHKSEATVIESTPHIS